MSDTTVPLADEYAALLKAIQNGATYHTVVHCTAANEAERQAMPLQQPSLITGIELYLTDESGERLRYEKA